MGNLGLQVTQQLPLASGSSGSTADIRARRLPQMLEPGYAKSGGRGSGAHDVRQLIRL
jgi:hypothetical protein